MQSQLFDALRGLRPKGAPFADLRLERRESTHLVFNGNQLDAVDVMLDYGGLARALSPQGNWGVVTFTGDDDLRDRVQDAIRLAALATPHAPIRLAPIEPVTAHVPAQVQIDFRSIPLADKRALLADYNEVMLRFDPRIETTLSVYLDAFVTTWYANTEGTYVCQEKPLVDVQFTTIARHGEVVQRGYKSLALARGYEAVTRRHDLPRSAAQLALDLLSARPVKGGRYTVVMDPIMSGLFAHEAIGHLSEADFIAENPRAREMMTLGRTFGPRQLNIYDDGQAPGLRGSQAYDDEGVPAQRTWLIRDGALAGRLHSRETAARMGERPTGNARATSYRYAPQVRMTNTAIAPADGGHLQDMIRDVELGVYALDWSGGETALENFTFVAKYGYLIRRGELAEPVRAITLTGDVFETLRNIDRIGSDFRWDDSSGDCGKGAEGLAVCDGGPHVRIQDALVGGQ